MDVDRYQGVIWRDAGVERCPVCGSKPYYRVASGRRGYRCGPHPGDAELYARQWRELRARWGRPEPELDPDVQLVAFDD